MALSLVRVTGNILLPNGEAPDSGVIFLQLWDTQGPVSATILDGSTKQKVGGRKVIELGSAGSVDFNLAPNDSITINGTTDVTKYLAEISLKDADGAITFRREWWVCNLADGVTQDIGALLLLNIPAAPVLGALKDAKFMIVSALTPDPPTPSMLGVVQVVDPGSGETAAYQAHRNAQDQMEWVLAGTGATPFSVVPIEPPTSGYAIGQSVIVDSGSGETITLTLHRDSGSSLLWAQAVNGGA